MRDYHINVFWSDDDESYVADIPDLFPCAAFGESPEAALAEVLVVKSAWLETARERGLPIPQPTYRSQATRAAG